MERMFGSESGVKVWVVIGFDGGGRDGVEFGIGGREGERGARVSGFTKLNSGFGRRRARK